MPDINVKIRIRLGLLPLRRLYPINGHYLDPFSYEILNIFYTENVKINVYCNVTNVTFCFSFWGTKYPGSPTGVLLLNSPGGFCRPSPRSPHLTPFEKLLNLSTWTWTLVGTATDARGGHRHASRFFRPETPLPSRRITICLQWRFWYKNVKTFINCEVFTIY